ncbi:MAG TPA: hypothetical protein VK832_14800 [Burkholderiaceae bacterium]|nr:hypothetical protein [Burkholderiaceae bacterium]
MTDIVLYSLHESQPGKQELVRAVWQRHFHAPMVNCKGLITSTYAIDSVDPNRSYIRLVFSDRESLEAFETSMSYSRYIWEVLPLLTHKPITRASSIEAHGDAANTSTVDDAQGKRELNAHRSRHLVSNIFAIIGRKIHRKQTP